MKPRLLDLFCGAGGAAMGYHRAGFDVVGVDINPQPNYPFEFVQADAMDYPLEGFDVIHASPPCQGYSRMRHLPWLKDKEYPLLIEPTRERLVASGVQWIIENVEDAPLEKMSSLFGTHGVWLCGLMFGSDLYRHRIFESSFPISQLPHPKHTKTILPGRLLNKRYSQNGGTIGVIVDLRFGVSGHSAGVMKYAPQAMGIDWMKREEINQAIPPAYTQYIGEQLLSYLERAA